MKRLGMGAIVVGAGMVVAGVKKVAGWGYNDQGMNVAIAVIGAVVGIIGLIMMAIDATTKKPR